MMLQEFIASKLVQSAFFVAIIPQIIKSIIESKRNGKYHWRYLFIEAGMPSTHTAFVVSIALSIYLIEGMSLLFLAATGFSLIIIRDVIGDKIFAGKQESIINSMFKKLVHREPIVAEWKHLTGHTLLEVLAGFAIGIIITLAVHGIR